MENAVKTNVGTVDRLIRLAIAAAAVGVFFTGERPVWEYLFLMIGAVLAVTALAGRCPLYRVIGLRTDRRDVAR